jgi:hypothetical protein
MSNQKSPGAGSPDNTIYYVETCIDIWKLRAEFTTKKEAYEEMDRLIRLEHWGTLSIRVQSRTRMRAVTLA